MNLVILIGNLGSDPEVTYTPGGMAIAKISLATSEKWKDKTSGEKKEKTEWHRIVAFGRLAEVCGEYLSKGKKISCTGSIQYSSWDKEDGSKGYATDIRMTQMEMLSTMNGSSGQGGGYSSPPTGGAAPGGSQAPGGRRLPGEEDDVPF